MTYRISSLMSSCINSLLESTIAAYHIVSRQLYKSSDQMHLDTLYTHVLSNCSDDETEYTARDPSVGPQPPKPRWVPPVDPAGGRAVVRGWYPDVGFGWSPAERLRPNIKFPVW
jgi:hypothetical protein